MAVNDFKQLKILTTDIYKVYHSKVQGNGWIAQKDCVAPVYLKVYNKVKGLLKF